MGYLAGYDPLTYDDKSGRYHDYSMARIHKEVQRQVELWGDQSRHDNLFWLGILMEEVGESAKAIIETSRDTDNLDHLIEEVVQVAAVATSWIDALMINKARKTRNESAINH